MNGSQTYLSGGALVCAALGALGDVRRGRIPNWLTYGGVVAGLTLRGWLDGWAGAKDGLAAILVGGGALFLFFAAGGMGAGDVKLMAAVGSWVGLKQTVVVMAATAFAGGIVAIGHMIFFRRVGSTVRNLWDLVRHHLAHGIQPHPELNLQKPRSMRLPYGLAIALGTLYSFAATVWRG